MARTLRTLLIAAIAGVLWTDAAGLVYDDDPLSLRREHPLSYKNHAEIGTYENPPWFNEFYPAARYYDLFGNHIIDGYHVYSIDARNDSLGLGGSTIFVEQAYQKWFNYLIVVGDTMDDRGIMGIVGAQIRTFFTPWTVSKLYYSGIRFDGYARTSYATLLTSRISNNGGDPSRAMLPETDWLTALRIFHDTTRDLKVGFTGVNIHHDEVGGGGSLIAGVDSDPATPHTPTGLSVFGIDWSARLWEVDLAGDLLRSQGYLDGSREATPGDVFTLRALRSVDGGDFRLGGEVFYVSPLWSTEFFCPAHPYGDAMVDINGNLIRSNRTERYLYQLVEDNDDLDEFPEDGRCSIPAVALGDYDGVFRLKDDRNKDGIFDFAQDFLSYDADPPNAGIFLDRNNNLVPDAVEDDVYPDYAYLPSYYLEGETYRRFSEAAGTAVDTLFFLSSMSPVRVHKGLQGVHLYGSYPVGAELTIAGGVLLEGALEETYQRLYTSTDTWSMALRPERSSNLYVRARYVRSLNRNGTVSSGVMLMKVNDNMPNHTAARDTFLDPSLNRLMTTYYVVPDTLPLRNSILARAEVAYDLSQNRGLNAASRLFVELGGHQAEMEHLYPARTTAFLSLLNKCQYIYAVPWEGLQGLFLIPQYKHVYQTAGHSTDGSGVASPLDAFYDRVTFVNYLNFVMEYKATAKTRLTLAYGLKRFDDIRASDESYNQRNFTAQLLINDHYRGFSVWMSCGFTNCQYAYDMPGTTHRAADNPHGVTDDIQFNEMFLRVHCGF